MMIDSFAFSGTGYDRAAHLRPKADPNDPAARSIVLWRGKVLVENGVLVRLPMDHPVLITEAERVFLGLPDGQPTWASDISAWEPQDADLSTVGSFVDPSQQQHPDLPAAQVFVELRTLLTVLSPLDAELAATAKAVGGWHVSHKFCAKCGQQSFATMAGWQRQCPACHTPHFPRTDPVVIMLITRGDNVLLGRSPGWPEGMYSVLAGFIEPGETIDAAVRREVAEETGIEVGEVSYLASQPWPFPASLMLGFRGQALTEEITIDPNELEAALWVSKDDLRLVFAGEHPVIKPPRKGAIAGYLMGQWLAE